MGFHKKSEMPKEATASDNQDYNFFFMKTLDTVIQFIWVHNLHFSLLM